MKSTFFRFGVIIVLFAVASVVFFPTVSALTPKEEKGVKVLKAPGIEYLSPTWFTPMPLEDAPEEIEYRIGILPYEEDRQDDLYVVLPTLGIITPIIVVPEGTQDYVDMTQGKEIDINKYLVEGVMHYPGLAMPGEVGNAVIFGHSNFFADQPGKYKTIFADLMNLDVDPRDEVWVYTKQADGTYELLKFAIEESYETVPTDVGILNPKGGKEITVFACTNGLDGRRIVRGRLRENDEILIPYPMLYRVRDSLALLKTKDELKQQDVRGVMLGEIERIRNSLPTDDLTYDDKFKSYILTYLEKQLLDA